jgi:hypothetical protein
MQRQREQQSERKPPHFGGCGAAPPSAVTRSRRRGWRLSRAFVRCWKLLNAVELHDCGWGMAIDWHAGARRKPDPYPCTSVEDERHCATNAYAVLRCFISRRSQS